MKSVPMRSMALVVLRRPRLWGEAVRAIPAFARKQWWRHPPFLPLPDPEYVQWRVATAYGSSDVEPVPEDVAGYLEWMRRQRR